MCGLVGIAGDLSYRDEATMQRLFLLDYFRGPDSTGFASVDRNGKVKVAKIASHPFDLFDSARFKSAMNGNMSTVFLGHNRAATRGLVNNMNAHPFSIGNIVGAHNGTLETGCIKMLSDMLPDAVCGTDSELLFTAIAKLGVEAVIPMIEEGRQQAHGAWALTWVDTEENTFNMLRNKHRPLWYAWQEDFKRLFWASEWQFIDHAITMNPIPYKRYKNEEGYTFFKLPEDIWYSIPIDLLLKGGDKLPKFKAKELKGKPPTPYTAGGNAGTKDPFGRGTGFHKPDATSRGKTTSTTTSPSTSVQKKVIHLSGDGPEYMSPALPREVYESWGRNDCQWCQTPVRYGEEGAVIYQRDMMVLCPTCAGHDDYVPEFDEPPTTRVYVTEDLYYEVARNVN